MKEAGDGLQMVAARRQLLDLPVCTAGGCGGPAWRNGARTGILHLFHGDEVFAAFFDFRFGDDQFQLTARDVDMDSVAVLHEP